MLFYTSSAKHIAQKIRVKKGKFAIKRFSDREICVKIMENVAGKKAWVLGSTFAPGDNMLELFFLLDALKREKAKINLIMPYFGYARQDRVFEKGQCLSSKVVCSFIKSFRPKITVIDMHSMRLKKYIKFRNIVPLELFYPIVKKMDIVAAPDKGALPSARKLGRMCRKRVVIMKKIRPKAEKAKIIEIKDHVKGKKVIIVDDMIATGGTIIEASKLLVKKGAKEVSVMVTHGVFTGNARAKLFRSPLKRIYVTDSIPQRPLRKIKVIGLAGLVEGIIKG